MIFFSLIFFKKNYANDVLLRTQFKFEKKTLLQQFSSKIQTIYVLSFSLSLLLDLYNGNIWIATVCWRRKYLV